jgi:hypothetical protein
MAFLDSTTNDAGFSPEELAAGNSQLPGWRFGRASGSGRTRRTTRYDCRGWECACRQRSDGAEHFPVNSRKADMPIATLAESRLGADFKPSNRASDGEWSTHQTDVAEEGTRHARANDRLVRRLRSPVLVNKLTFSAAKPS